MQFISRRMGVGLSCLFLLTVPLFFALPADAQPYTVLHAFNVSDGENAYGGLVQGSDGNFYGTTADGGTKDWGTVFKITPSGTLTTLHSFVGYPGDGAYPFAGLVEGSDGNFYGTTSQGGASNAGTVFKITPSGTLTTLHSFAGSDGRYSRAGLVQGSDGNFYGTTVEGGTGQIGTVFKITPAGTLTKLYSFAYYPDGAAPYAGLVQGSDGNFYGTTSGGGGTGGIGTVFKITPAGTLTTLHSFTGSDGAVLYAGLVQGTDGNFYGTTSQGGASDRGTVFKITPSGTLTTLHSFAGSDGVFPRAGLVQGSDGNFYGTTYSGGTSGEGTIFKITPGGTLTTLYSFAYYPDGALPAAGLVQGSDGNFYGTTLGGGPIAGPGVVFRLASGGTGDATVALLPSSARAPGAGGAFYTTDVTVANTGTSDTQLTLKFLGNNKDGSGGAERSFPLAAGRSTTYADILGSVFGETSNFGAIRISSSLSSFVVLGQTSTPGFGGTFGQSVPAARPSDLITSGAPRSIVGVREDGAFRTNLILSNSTSASLDVDVALFADTGASLGNKRYPLAPLGMTQVTRVVRDVGFSADVRGARVVLSTPTAGGSFAAYASAIDNVTNDPRTLLPKGPIASPQPTNVWFLPSSARAPGAGGAFYTTDLLISNMGAADTTFALKFLGHDQDGTGGSEQPFALAAGKTVTYADVLGSVFSVSSGFGAIRITSPSAALNILGQTSTPGFGGTFGQSVPASALEDLIVSGSPRSLVAVREDAAFRTNVILCNTTAASLDVDATLVASSGSTLVSKRYTLPPLGMTQVTRIVRDMGVSGDVIGARLVLSTPTSGGVFAAYASAIDDTTNDPRTLLPK